MKNLKKINGLFFVRQICCKKNGGGIVAFVSILNKNYNEKKFLEECEKRGRYYTCISSKNYNIYIGNHSEALLRKMFCQASDKIAIAFDAQPWVYDEILLDLYERIRRANENLTLQLIIDEIREIKADFHCVLLYEDKPYIFHSLISNRPFFYYCKGNTFIASSSLKSIQILTGERVDKQHLAEFIIPQYSNPNSTVWKNINRLKPGYYASKFETKCFQEISFDDSIMKADVEELVVKLKNLFCNAVKRSLYGENIVLLSGGIDSSSIVCTAIQYMSNIKGYSLVYNSDLTVCDEQEYVDEIVKQYGLDVCRLVADEIVPLSKVIDDTDEPELWPYTIRNYALLNKIAQELNCDNYINVIAGEGGDELLLGQVFSLFDRFQELSWTEGISELLYESDIKAKLEILKLLSDGYYDTEGCITERLEVDIPEWIKPSYIEQYNITHSIVEAYPTFKNTDRMTSKYSQYLFSKMGAAGQVECGGWHEDEILKFGLNAAYPFLDYELAEFVWSLPGYLLRYNAKEKWILRRALEEWVPKKIFDRTDKTEATPMLDKGIMENVDKMLQINENSYLSKLGIIDYKKYRDAVYQYMLGRVDLRVPLWATYSTEKWIERNEVFFDE